MQARMQRTRKELEALLLKSQETLKNSQSVQRKLTAVITKVKKVVGPQRSVKKTAPK
jgi:hypothetical protein